MTQTLKPGFSTTEPLLPRVVLSPTYFTSLHLDGLSLEKAIHEYLDWVEGVRAYKKRRSSRELQGVPSKFNREALLNGTSPILSNGCELTVRHNAEKFLLRFVHRDDQKPDIWWHSVVRITSETTSKGILVEHATGRASPPHLNLRPVAGAPIVVGNLCALPSAKPRARDLFTKGPIHIRKDEAKTFVRHVLMDDNRSHPYLVVSALKDSNTFLVDPDVLAKRLSTQAVVVKLDDDATWLFADAFEELGFDREYGHCFDGAARVYQTGIKKSRSPRDHYLWFPERFETYGSTATERLAGEVAERITWRALPPRFFAILEEWDRNESRAQAETLLQRETANAKNLQLQSEIHAQEIAELRHQLRTAQEERTIWERDVIRHEAEINELRQLLEIAEQERDQSKHKEQLASVHLASLLKTTNNGLNAPQKEALRDVLRGGPRSLEQALHVLNALFSDRVIILPSAWSSAKESAAFQKPEKAFELMLVLVQEYFVEIQNGGDSAGKKCFSSATFASRESESVEGRKGAQKLRTFQYNGNPIVMWKHLKIGVKDSVAETWRLHFEFDPDAKKIVIGHCGRHLDFK
ncbi:hypothetical protein [Archangium sp. Cb G35]|uniref:hypothetical protein n=1 Tax=Archangium sp. Cb G35 TaxID=1920190 RepID=UPI000A796517|nr:hypothetical protein [Archangium sp. Cb G35]